MSETMPLFGMVQNGTKYIGYRSRRQYYLY